LVCALPFCLPVLSVLWHVSSLSSGGHAVQPAVAKAGRRGKRQAALYVWLFKGTRRKYVSASKKGAAALRHVKAKAKARYSSHQEAGTVLEAELTATASASQQSN